MKKTILVGTLAVVMLTTVLVAGCVNPLSPSPTPSPSPTAGTAGTTQNATNLSLSPYLTDTMKAKNYTVVTAFTRYVNPQTGAVYYNCTVHNANGTYYVSYQVMPTAQAAQVQYVQVTKVYVSQGYQVMQQNATAWSGHNATAAKNVGVAYVTSPLMKHTVVTVTQENASTPQSSAQQNAWMQTWNTIHNHASTAGSTLSTATRTHLQAALQQNVTSSPMTATTTTSTTTTSSTG